MRSPILRQSCQEGNNERHLRGHWTLTTYDTIGRGYGHTRREDPRITAAISAQIAPCRSVLNVGAGLGSYEPRDRFVVGADISTLMLRQRPPGSGPAVQADASRLPFPNNSFDGTLAVLTLHHWDDWRAGLKELIRVASKTTVILTWYPIADDFWLFHYFPELRLVDSAKFPSADQIADIVGPIDVRPLPIPHDCEDGFLGAYWRRPELYLDDPVRNGISSFHQIKGIAWGVEKLREDLDSGAWKRDNADLLQRADLDLGYRIVVSTAGRNL